ncbi:hypothetical protein HPP92_016867 [Vanilla planifolia]|uniref:Uncharacterized protein n=1 Tax=Vanilla planifolia TaxID=51239 RepID=A0A835QK07_VANPL|nr:hypothetical protein HPP92_016867 [Vanilla planifolia]
MVVMEDVLAKGRESCYKARDAFYACLEKEADKKPTELASVGLLYPGECKKSREEFVKSCRPTWVKHFDRQYCVKREFRDFLMVTTPAKDPFRSPSLTPLSPSCTPC